MPEISELEHTRIMAKLKNMADKVNSLVTNNYQIPKWMFEQRLPVLISSGGSLMLYMRCAVTMRELVWDPQYGHPCDATSSTTIEGGWNPVPRPPIMSDAYVYCGFLDGANYLSPGNVVSSVVFPHARPNGACFINLNDMPRIASYEDYERLRTRIERFLGGANLASLYSGWSAWNEEVRATIPPNIAQYLQQYEDSTQICVRAVRKNVPFDYTAHKVEEETWSLHHDADYSK